MFHDAVTFNQPLNWNTEKVEDMSEIFYNAINFNQSLNWDTQNVTKKIICLMIVLVN